MSFNIAIDGPAGAGKSTIAKRIAENISFLYVDTGAMYRAMAYAFLTRGIPADDAAALRRSCGDIRISLVHEDGRQRVFLNDKDITDQIRREEVGNMASAVSGYSFVREKLLDMQREIAAQNDVIMDGRDIGTCVLPDAQLKIFLTASVHTRAMRRYRELTERGSVCVPEEIEKDIEERDYRDTHREIAPLRAADDAVTIDTSDMGIDEVVREILNLAAAAGIRK